MLDDYVKMFKNKDFIVCVYEKATYNSIIFFISLRFMFIRPNEHKRYDLIIDTVAHEEGLSTCKVQEDNYLYFTQNTLLQMTTYTELVQEHQHWKLVCPHYL